MVGCPWSVGERSETIGADFDSAPLLSTASVHHHEPGVQPIAAAQHLAEVDTRRKVRSRQNRIETAIQAASDNELRLSTSLSDVENADLPKTIMDLQMQQVAYQASLGATSRVMQPSLLDFLR